MKKVKCIQIKEDFYNDLLTPGYTLRELRVLFYIFSECTRYELLNKKMPRFTFTELSKQSGMDGAHITPALKSLVKKGRLKKSDGKYYLM